MSGWRVPVLRPGACVAVLSPSGPAPAEDLRRGLAWLETRYRVWCPESSFARKGYLAGDDALRSEALLEAFQRPELEAILCARGGYGAMRILEGVGPALRTALREKPLLLAGFSDITALGALWFQQHTAAVHGPMLAALGGERVSAQDRARWLLALEGAELPPWEGLKTWVSGVAEGRAAGGNLSLLAALQGTPWSFPLEHTILCLEDVGERPYRVDRMLSTLRLSGALRSLRGVVLGDFAECLTGPDGVEVETVLREAFASLGVPVVAGAPFGHGVSCQSFRWGQPVRLVAHETGGSVEFLPWSAST